MFLKLSYKKVSNPVEGGITIWALEFSGRALPLKLLLKCQRWLHKSFWIHLQYWYLPPNLPYNIIHILQWWVTRLMKEVGGDGVYFQGLFSTWVCDARPADREGRCLQLWGRSLGAREWASKPCSTSAAPGRLPPWLGKFTDSINLHLSLSKKSLTSCISIHCVCNMWGSM